MKKTRIFIRIRFAAIITVLLLTCLVIFPTYAQEDESRTDVLPAEYLDFLDRLPENVKELLPKEVFSDDPATVASAVEEMSSLSFLLRTALSMLGLHFNDCLMLLARLVGLVLLSAVIRSIKVTFLKESVAAACTFLINLVMLIALLSAGYETVLSVKDYFRTLGELTGALLPLTATLYAIGGNVSTAAASSSGLSVFMTVLEEFVGASILPFCSVCLAFCAIGAMNPSQRTGTLLSTVKKNYTLALTFLMMLLITMLAAQTTLTARADTLAMKSAKFAAGNLIPVVGGSVSELLRSVSAGVSYLRGTVGVCAVILLLLTLLPTLAELLLLRLTWQLGASFADLLSCDGEKRLMEEFASLCGYLIAAASICSSVLLLSLTLFIRCASAIG